MIGTEIPVRSGVYVIEAEEGLYVGQSRNIYQRWRGHLTGGKLHDPVVIYIELIDNDEWRKYREFTLMREFDEYGVKILNKIR